MNENWSFIKNVHLLENLHKEIVNKKYTSKTKELFQCKIVKLDKQASAIKNNIVYS